MAGQEGITDNIELWEKLVSYGKAIGKAKVPMGKPARPQYLLQNVRNFVGAFTPKKGRPTKTNRRAWTRMEKVNDSFYKHD